MSLNLSKLQNVVDRDDGTKLARCPACAATGGDKKGEHLIINGNGAYGCVVTPGDKEHNKAIFALAGNGAGVNDAPQPIKLISVKTFRCPPPVVLIDLGNYERFVPRGALSPSSGD